MAHNRVIGSNNQMPWHLPADLRHFKQKTMGKVIVMGHNTFKSIGRALPGRRNLVLTRSRDTKIDGCDVFHDLDQALSTIDLVQEEVIVIGGAQLYAQTLPLIERMYLTIIDCDVSGDTYFPQWDKLQWRLASELQHPADADNAYACRFLTYQRID